MERYQTINEYVAAEMGGKIVSKANSPLPGLLTLAAGIVLLVLVRTDKMPDALMATCVTVGIIALGTGLILTAMSFTKALSHYVYLPTQSRMRRRKCYLGSDDYQRCLEAIGSHDIGVFATLEPVNSSNNELDILYSRDHAVVLLQAIRDNNGHFEEESPVVCLNDIETTHIQKLCK